MEAAASRGFTLIELLVVLALAGLLAGMGYPAMQGLVERSAHRAATGQLQNALTLARHSAITRRESVYLCPRAVDKDACGGDWSRPLLVVARATRAPLPPERILRELPGVDLAVTYNRGWKRVRFDSLGHSAGHNGTFTVCPAGSATAGGAAVVLSQLGRTSVEPAPDAC